MDYLSKNDTDFYSKFPMEMFKTISPISDITSAIPQAFKPLVEQVFNHVGFTSRALIPERMKQLPPEQQYNLWTSETAKEFGRITGISPKRIEHIITSYTAGTGRNVLFLTDEILEMVGMVDPPTKEDSFTSMSRWPILRGVLAAPQIGLRGRSVQIFYDKLDELETINRGVNQFLKTGDEDNLFRFFDGNDKKQDDYIWYRKNLKTINKFSEIMRLTRFLVGELAREKGIKDKIGLAKKLNVAINLVALQFREKYEKNENWDDIGLVRSLHRNLKEVEGKRSRLSEGDSRALQRLIVEKRLYEIKVRNEDRKFDVYEKRAIERIREKIKLLELTTRLK